MPTERPESGFKTNPDYKITFEPSPRRVRVKFNGEIIADSTTAHLLFETRHLPVYYFPRSDVRMDLMTPTDHHTFAPTRAPPPIGRSRSATRSAENAVWSYPDPFDEVAAIKDYVAFYWNRVDAWYEEDEEIFVHPRDPYKRVDVLNSSRPVQVVVGGKSSPRPGARGSCSRRGCRPAITSRPKMCGWIFSCRARRSPAAPTRARRATIRSRSAAGLCRPRLELSRPDPGMPENQGTSLLFQRARRRDLRRRRAGAASGDPVVEGLEGAGGNGPRPSRSGQRAHRPHERSQGSRLSPLAASASR